MSFPALIVLWEDDEGTPYRVAELERRNGGWRFRYLYEVERAREAGFGALGGFPFGRKEFESKELFPAIRRRIPDLRRSDVRERLRDKAGLPEEDQYYWYLRLTKGRLLGDRFRFESAGSSSAGVADPAVRAELRRTVRVCRETLEEDFRRQLEGRYGIKPGASIIPAGEMAALETDGARRRERERVLEILEHLKARGMQAEDAYRRLIREAAFTILNRLAALKLMEDPSRELIRESVGQGSNSKGFREFSRVAPGALRSLPDGGYRRYLEFLFDDVDEEVGILFDRSTAQSLLFPSESALGRVLELLNAGQLSAVWADDETLGWVYQYFTPKEERDETHKKRGRRGPADSHELAFLNQFYTPRYVVDFLIEHSLGSLKRDMEEGRRPKLDPRELRLLDPACGSGHFLLRAFDRVLEYYRESFDDPTLGPALRRDYSDLATFKRNVPGLILGQNLHGIDIDLRAVQVAALALYLRAQRYFKEEGLKPADRPPVSASSLAVAEAMPGEDDLFEEFCAEEIGVPFLRELARAVRTELAKAGEIGSLLRVQEDLSADIASAREAFANLPKQADLPLQGFTDPTRQGELSLEGIEDSTFFDRAEDSLFRALHHFASRHGGDSFRRRVFGKDSEQALRFLDVARRRYDVVLMNPPFGQPSWGAVDYIKASYPRTSNDLFAAFVERGLEWLRSGGYLGAITSRTGFFLRSFQKWREEILIGENSFRVMADFGSGVLDATVEVAAYVIEKGKKEPRPALFFRALKEEDKAAALAEIQDDPRDSRRFQEDAAGFSEIESSPFAYWLPARIRNCFSTGQTLEPEVAEVCQGLSTADDPQFVRVIWEVNPQDLILHSSLVEGLAKIAPVVQPTGKNKWALHVKSGTSQPWYAPQSSVVNWEGDGQALREFKYDDGKPRAVLRNAGNYFRPGFSWTRRAVRLIPYIVQANSIPTASRYQAFPSTGQETAAVGFCAANVASAYLRLRGEKFAWPNFLVENLKSLPWPQEADSVSEDLDALVAKEVAQRRNAYSYFEPFQEFVAPLHMEDEHRPADDLSFDPNSLLGRELEVKVAQAYGLNEADLEVLERDLREALEARKGGADEEDEEDSEDGEQETVIEDTPAHRAEALVSYAVGCLFGRWDVRILKDRSLAPKPAGPFDPLPLCPPGMLVGPGGMPATPEAVASEEWLRARPDALHLPPEGAVKTDVITSEEYPIPVAWGGIMPDDPEDERDIVRGIRKVFEFVYGDRAGSVEEAICSALDVRDLRRYLSSPRAFFYSHIQRYSGLKGKRKAPVYWLLQSKDKSYGLWVYYHRLSRDTLYSVIGEFVTPRLRRAEGAHKDAKGKKGRGKEGSAGRKKAESLLDVIDDLQNFRSGLERASRVWDPYLDDGVLLNMAPVSAVIPWPAADKTRRGISAGKFPWSRVARKMTGRD